MTSHGAKKVGKGKILFLRIFLDFRSRFLDFLFFKSFFRNVKSLLQQQWCISPAQRQVQDTRGAALLHDTEFLKGC